MESNSLHIPKWEKRLALGLELFIGISGVIQILLGNIQSGVLILIALGFIVFPKFFTHHLVKRIPIEIEIVLFVMVLLQYILGGSLNFYERIPYYDKLVHFMLPMFTGLIGFLIAYTMYALGRLKATGVSIIIVVALISLGIGALWEIIEYLNDILIYPWNPWHHFQGNAQQDANTDTMTDLIDDLLGGIAGGFLGYYFMEKSGFKRSVRAAELTKELKDGLFGK